MSSFEQPQAPTAPPGWHTTWSDQHNQWYYVDTATGSSQWDYPYGTAAATQPGVTPQPTYSYPGEHHYPQQESTSSQADAEQESSRGLVSMAAGAVLGNKMQQHSTSSDHHNIFDSMTTFLGGATVGALGAKFFGGKKQPQPTYNASSNPHPPYQGYPTSSPPAPFYPTQSPPFPVHMSQMMPPGSTPYGVGAGVGAGAAVGAAIGAAPVIPGNGVSNYPQYHYPQPSVGVPATGGSNAMGNFHGGSFNSGPRLVIHSATFADKDVTERVRMLINSEQQISIQKKMTEEFGDPWPESTRKGLSILYQYGDRPMEVWAGSTENESVTIKNEALSNKRMAYVNKTPGRIVCLIWGQESVLSDIRIEKLEKEGELDCKDLDNGGWWAWEPRTLICFYRDQQGGIGIGHAREGGTIRLPWNPLAKWS